MNYFLIATVLVFLSATFGFINVRFLKSPNTIGLMVITILFTLGVFVLSYFDDMLLNAEKYIITQIDFKTLLLDIMLSFLLFAVTSYKLAGAGIHRTRAPKRVVMLMVKTKDIIPTGK